MRMAVDGPQERIMPSRGSTSKAVPPKQGPKQGGEVRAHIRKVVLGFIDKKRATTLAFS